MKYYRINLPVRVSIINYSNNRINKYKNYRLYFNNFNDDVMNCIIDFIYIDYNSVDWEFYNIYRRSSNNIYDYLYIVYGTVIDKFLYIKPIMPYKSIEFEYIFNLNSKCIHYNENSIVKIFM